MERALGKEATWKSGNGLCHCNRMRIPGLLDGGIALDATSWTDCHLVRNSRLPVAGILRNWAGGCEIPVRVKRLCNDLARSQACIGERRRSKTVTPAKRESYERLSRRFSKN